MASDTEVTVAGFQAVFHNVRLPFGLVIQEVKLSAADTLVDKDPWRLELSQPGTISAKVVAEDLQEFLEREAPGGLHDFKISLSEGKVNVEASIRMIVEIRASAICSLEIVDGRKLMVKLETVDVLGVGAKSLVENQLAKINPVLDVEEVPLNIQLQSVEIAEGAVILQGTAQPRTS